MPAIHSPCAPGRLDYYDGADYHTLPGSIDFNDYENQLRITTALPPP